jgi:hypothetical protein
MTVRIQGDNSSASPAITGDNADSGIVVGTNVEIISTGALVAPVGTTAQRPASPDAGSIRFNSTTGFFEYWSSTSSTPQWRQITQDPIINITATGGTTSTSGGNTIHTFTTSGTFEITAGSGDVTVVEVLEDFLLALLKI